MFFASKTSETDLKIVSIVEFYDGTCLGKSIGTQIQDYWFYSMMVLIFHKGSEIFDRVSYLQKQNLLSSLKMFYHLENNDPPYSYQWSGH